MSILSQWRGVCAPLGCICLVAAAPGPGHTAAADVTWSPPVVLSDSAAQEAELTGSADGSRLIGAWSGAAGVETAFSIDAGATWSRPRTIAPAWIRWMRMAASDDGMHAIITWQRRIPSGETRKDMPRVQFSISADGGRTWTRARTVPVGGRRDTPANPVISHEGRHLGLAFARKVSRYAAMVVTSDDGGVRWTEPRRLSAGADLRVQAPAIAASSDGARMIVAWESLDGAIHVRTTSGRATGWTPDVVALRSNDPTRWGPEVRMSADGRRAIVASTVDDAGSPEVAIASTDDSAGGWTAHRIPSEGIVDARLLMSGSGDDLVVVWATADSLRTAFSSDAGVTWSPPHPLWAQVVPRPWITSTALVGSIDATTATAAWLSSDGTDAKRMTTTSTVDGGTSWSTPATAFETRQYDYGLHASADGSRLSALVLGDGLSDAGVGYVAGEVIGAAGGQPPADVQPWRPRPIAVAKAVQARTALKVRVKPRFGKKEQWDFYVRERTSSGWRTLRTKTGSRKTFTTSGTKHIRVLDLPRGVYKVRVLSARGYRSETSTRVKLRY